VTAVELCIHFANLFYLASFLVRDMFWLRLLTCCGLGFGIVFFTCQPAPMYGPTGWHVLFLGINLVQIRRLVSERRRMRLTEEQERIAQAAFEHLTREELLTLLTRVTGEKPRRLRELHRMCRQELTQDEQLLKDLAFSRLSRKELLLILTWRLWKTIKVLNPARWRRGRAAAAETPGVVGGPSHG
jgi:hypothetical protein